jgi:hypothetical protein
MSTGQVTTLFVEPSNGFMAWMGYAAKMNHPFGMCLNPHENCLYVSDFTNHKIIKVAMNGIDFTLFHC